ncbi:hypothetical protein ADL27_08200, partial [Streptomyces sp. NRRL F-6602]
MFFRIMQYPVRPQAGRMIGMTPRGTAEPQVRPGIAEDLNGLTNLYNHYVLRTPITFDTVPLTPEGRMQWFLSHPKDGPHRLM